MGYFDQTIKDVLQEIEDGRLFLPAIQRKFVWKEDQITKLFDSLMRGYPIGTFLFWDIDKEKDDIVDDLLDAIVNSTIKNIEKSNIDSKYSVNVLFIAKYLERVADHATNICEWLLYIVN